LLILSSVANSNLILSPASVEDPSVPFNITAPSPTVSSKVIAPYWSVWIKLPRTNGSKFELVKFWNGTVPLLEPSSASSLSLSNINLLLNPTPVLSSRTILSPWWSGAVVSFSCLKNPDAWLEMG